MYRKTSSHTASLVPPKRSRDSSPLDTRRDSDNPSKKQLVLWRLSIRQLIEQQHALATGKVPSSSSISSHLHAPVFSSREASRSSLTHSSTTLDPCRRLHVPYLPSQPLAALNSSHQSNPVRTLRGQYGYVLGDIFEQLRGNTCMGTGFLLENSCIMPMKNAMH